MNVHLVYRRPLENIFPIIRETFEGVGDITSKLNPSAEEALDIGQKFLGKGYSEMGKAGEDGILRTGVFRSKDQLRQFRMDNNSLLGLHAPDAPHIHLECY